MRGSGVKDPSFPEDGMTLWQGINRGNKLPLQKLPMARAAPGWPMASASSL